MAAVELSGLSHAYGRGAMRRQVLQNISLRIDPGEVVPVSYTHLTLPTRS